MLREIRSVVAVAFVLVVPSVLAQDTADQTWDDLVDDYSRSQLGDYEMLHYAPPGQKEVRKYFVFPDHASDGIYGMDVSHHNGLVAWTRLADAGVKFVYIKASQGSRFRDPRFNENWRGAADAGVVRGAYHFLSAGIDGAVQARSYLALIAKAGGLAANDLTPVLDLEWDFDKRGTDKIDRWSEVPREKIIQAVTAWIDTVQSATGRRPIIYTAASWWDQRLGGEMSLKEYPHWLADYRVVSFKNGAPKSVKGHRHLIWQFTDVGTLSSAGGKFDVNRLKGKDLGLLSGK